MVRAQHGAARLEAAIALREHVMDVACKDPKVVRLIDFEALG